MIYGINSNSNKVLNIPIENYANQLAFYMEHYLNRVQESTSMFSSKADEKAKIALRWLIFPNEKEFKKDFKLIENDIGNKTWNIINHYTKCIMQLLGQVAECVVVDRCSTDSEMNKICINIAKFKNDIYCEYPDIKYEDYIAFSTSFKYLIYKDAETGLYRQHNVPDYNPNHTSKDIAWCKKDNILSQLKTSIDDLNYLDNAKLQIKTTIKCENLDLDSYFLTPVICFDLGNDFYKLKQKYPSNIIIPARDIRQEMQLEIEKYFQILAAYATGMIDHINITDVEVSEDMRLAELFRTPIMNLVKKQELDIAGVIDLAEERKKPIILNG